MNLIEILIVTAIVGILSAFIIPSYEHHLMHANRFEGKISLEKLAAALEEYALQNNTYENATLEKLNITSPRHYQLIIESTTKSNFSLLAEPLNSQEKDTECATLTFDSQGTKGITGTGSLYDCWS